MAVRVTLGTAMDGRGDRLFEGAVREKALDGYLHVVRTATRAEDLIAIARRASGVFVGGSVTTLPDLVARLSSRRTTPRRGLSGEERAFLIDEIARTESKPPLSGVFGLPDWLGDLFSRLKQGNVFSGKVAYEQFPSLNAKDPGTAEAIRLFDLYQDRLKAGGLYDEDGLYLEVARDLGTQELPIDRVLPQRRRLVVEGFYQCNVVERAVFERLALAYDDVDWLLDVPSLDAIGEFGHEVYADDVTWLREALKASFVDSSATPPPAPAAFERIVAFDERDEARFLVERAAALLRDDPSSDVVIAYPSDRAAAPLLEEAAADLSLPLSVAAHRSLSETASAQALLALFELPRREFARDRVVACLRGSPRGFSFGEDRERLTAPLLDRASREAGVVSGAPEWDRRLGEFENQIRTALTDADSDDARAHLERRLSDASLARRGMAALLALLPSDDRLLEPAAAATLMRDVSDAFGILRPHPIRLDTLDPIGVRAQAFVSRSARALDQVLEAYRAAATLAPSARPFSSHVASLRALIRAKNIPPAPPHGRGVRLIGLREIRGVRVDHLLVGGLSESDWPGATDAVPLLDERDAARAGARTRERRRREAEHLLLQALLSPRRSLVLCRPLRRDGADALPSPTLEGIESPGTPEVSATVHRDERHTAGRSNAGARALVSSLSRAGANLALLSYRAKAQRERMDPARVGRFEGMLEPSALPLLLSRHDPDRVVMSVSGLGKYVQCPLRFFIEKVLGVSEEDDVERDLSPLERGSLVHRILYRFHEEDAKTPGRDRAARGAALERIARDEFAELRRDDLFIETYVASLTRGLRNPSDRPGVLARYLDYEDSRPKTFRPYAFEATFGAIPRDGTPRSIMSGEPIEIAVPGTPRKLRLHGSIDRIDVADFGAAVEAVILDYKTGYTKDLKQSVTHGLDFQLPLYAAIVPRLLRDRFGGRPVQAKGAAYFALHPKDGVKIRELLLDATTKVSLIPAKDKRLKELAAGDFQDLVEAQIARAADVVQSIAGGVFHPTQIDAGCENCDLRPACPSRDGFERLARFDPGVLFPQSVDLLADCAEEAAP